jgi:hypothetical protein
MRLSENHRLGYERQASKPVTFIKTGRRSVSRDRQRTPKGLSRGTVEISRAFLSSSASVEK